MGLQPWQQQLKLLSFDFQTLAETTQGKLAPWSALITSIDSKNPRRSRISNDKQKSPGSKSQQTLFKSPFKEHFCLVDPIFCSKNRLVARFLRISVLLWVLKSPGPDPIKNFYAGIQVLTIPATLKQGWCLGKRYAQLVGSCPKLEKPVPQLERPYMTRWQNSSYHLATKATFLKSVDW